MSLPPDSLDPIPADTARVAQAAFPKGSLAIRLRAALGSIYHDGMFADLYPVEGQPALAPWRLALVTILQYAENLPDRQAAEAVRGRIDWKYALALPLEHPGFDYTVLSTFRDRLVAGGAEERLLWAVLDACAERGLLRKRGRVRTDATHVLAAVRTLNRLELVGETLRAALEALAVADPAWVAAHLPPDWATRYGRRIEETRLPEGDSARQAWAEETGRDGSWLLTQVAAVDAPAWLPQLPAVRMLEQVWDQQYERTGTQVRWRTVSALPPGEERITSPYDAESRYGEKRRQGWVGSKAHLTESCEDELPHLLLQVVTTPASQSDQTVTEAVWEDLAARDLLPGEHLMDQGYIDAAGLLTARDRGIDLVGPIQPDSSWQARAKQGYAASDFQVDWEQERVRCPQGKESHTWVVAGDGHGGSALRIRFARTDCAACSARTLCPRSTRSGRTLTLLPTQALYAARQAAQERQTTAAFRRQYRARAGIEGTMSQAVRRTGLRQARYRSQAKLHLQHCAEAAALNVIRLADWFDQHPRARTRQSHLARLLAPAA
jgi:transposase